VRRRRAFGSLAKPVLHVRWMGLWPRKSMEFWLEVAKRVRRRGLRARDLDGVRSVCAEVERVKSWTH
jgi:hypothetical protein